MLTAFWSGLGGEFAKRIVVRVLTPAFAFWIGGLTAVWWHAHAAGVQAHGWSFELAKTAKPFQALPALGQVVLLVGALLLLAVSALAAERLTLLVLRLLEGYWSRPVWLWRLLVRASDRRRRHVAARVGELAPRQMRGGLSIAEYIELQRLTATPQADQKRRGELQHRREQGGLSAQDSAALARSRRLQHAMPTRPELCMPTRLGNVLRAAERLPSDKYGLDPRVCWTALWLVLPAETKTELVQARTALDTATRSWLWGVLFLVWTPWSWWAIPIGLLVPASVYYVGMIGAAAVFGDLIVAAFDLYRTRLYDQLRLPRPTWPADEWCNGELVCQLLWGGLDEDKSKLRFTDAANPLDQGRVAAEPSTAGPDGTSGTPIDTCS